MVPKSLYCFHSLGRGAGRGRGDHILKGEGLGPKQNWLKEAKHIDRVVGIFDKYDISQ